MSDTLRLSKWFTDLGPVDPTDPNSPIRNARYNGQFGEKPDPIGQGNVGQTYIVRLSSATKLYAPNPPFQDPEGGLDE